MRAWVTVGYFDDVGDGAVYELDAADGSIREVLRFTPPAALLVPTKGFTGAARTADGDLLIAGASAVYRFSGDLEHVGTLHHPSFNDLHGVTVSGDRLYVVNTGLDCVEVFDPEGRFRGTVGFESGWLVGERMTGLSPSRESWSQLRDVGWKPRSFEVMDSDQPEGYYTSTQQPFHRSKVRDYVHPNHVVEVDGQLWVTSLLRQSVVSAPTWETLFRSGAGLHDGVVEGDEIWVTRVDGVVEARCLRSPARCRARWDVSKPSGVSGWCRGLHVTRTHMWVGFTAMRRAARLPWSVGALEETQTAVVLMDHSNGVPVRSFRMPGERHTKVFSILEAP